MGYVKTKFEIKSIEGDSETFFKWNFPEHLLILWSSIMKWSLHNMLI